MRVKGEGWWVRGESWRGWLRQPTLWLGMGIGAGAAWAALELAYVNWPAVVPPVVARPLVVRQDAKGDGQYFAPRSGDRRHRGVDLVAPLGSPVSAIRSGRVIEVGIHRGLGNFVELDHGRGLRSLYAHLATTQVRVGQRMRQGDVIGTVGKTGNARHPWIAPHVHLEVTRRGQPVDPATLGLDIIVASTTEEQHADSRSGE